jgi:hypothetical protein
MSRDACSSGASSASPGLRRGHRLERREDLVDLLHVGRGHRQYAHAVARNHLDEPLLLEPNQRFAQRRSTDAELLGERLLERLVAWRIGVVEDPAAQGLVGRVDERAARRGATACAAHHQCQCAGGCPATGEWK